MNPILQFIIDNFTYLVAVLNLGGLLLLVALSEKIYAHRKLDVKKPSLRIFLWSGVPILAVSSWYSSFLGVFNLTVLLLLLAGTLRSYLFCDIAEEDSAFLLSIIKIKKSKYILYVWLQGICYMALGGLLMWLSNGSWGLPVGLGIATFGLKIGVDSTRFYLRIYKKYGPKSP